MLTSKNLWTPPSQIQDPGKYTGYHYANPATLSNVINWTVYASAAAVTTSAVQSNGFAISLPRRLSKPFKSLTTCYPSAGLAVYCPKPRINPAGHGHLIRERPNTWSGCWNKWRVGKRQIPLYFDIYNNNNNNNNNTKFIKRHDAVRRLQRRWRSW